MKFGLDYHGVIDRSPVWCARFSYRVVTAGHELHIITGHETTDYFLSCLELFDISYTHIFSIADYHKSIGTDVWYDEKQTPWMDENTWNNAKAEYCEREGIDLHIDDSKRYLESFSTPYMHVHIPS